MLFKNNTIMSFQTTTHFILVYKKNVNANNVNNKNATTKLSLSLKDEYKMRKSTSESVLL